MLSIATPGPQIVEYVLNHAEVKVVFCAETTQLRALLKVLPKCPTIRAVIQFAYALFSSLSLFPLVPIGFFTQLTDNSSLSLSLSLSLPLDFIS